MAETIYTTADAAEMIGASRQTLYSWLDRGHVTTAKWIMVSGQRIRLWTKPDIQKAKKFKGALRPGPRTTEN